MKRMLLTCGMLAALPLAAAEPAPRAMTSAEIAAHGHTPGAATYLTYDAGLALKDADLPGTRQVAAIRLTSFSARNLRPNGATTSLSAPPTPGSVNCTPDGSDSFADMQVRLPDGAALQFMRIWGADTVTQALQASFERRCQASFDGSNVTITNLATITTSGNGGELTTSISIPGSITIDNEQCTYHVRVRFGDSPSVCSDGLTLHKVRFQWTD